MNRNDAFSRCHPLVNFLYFALVLLGAMLLQHPVCQAISLIGAIACFCTLGGEKPGGFRLWYALALFAVTAAVNPAFSHEGRTILRYLPSGNPLTLESILYGIGAGLTLCTALVWFSCYTRVMTSDKFVYLFGRIVPALSLVLSMTLRFVPRFSAQARRVSKAQAAVGNDMHTGSLLHRIKCALMVFSILVTWSLENAVDTADSMRARGYGLPGRSAFSIFTLTKRDKLLLAALSLLGVIVAAGYAAGALSWRYYPSCKGAGLTWTSALCWLSDLALNLIPAILDGKEAAVCRRLQSQI
ncbi:MAG: energy-coupling factor transporter transmembrane component T [Clostridiales bacterium]|nr:energy-coupling factor transporter transmembrane component T [Clostridiales bacterium]